VALIQPLGQDILGTAAQDVHAVLEVYVILTLHFIDFNLKKKKKRKREKKEKQNKNEISSKLGGFHIANC